MWDFSTEPEFQAKLDWMDAFIRDEVEPLDLVYGGQAYRPLDDELRPIVEPLKQQVREKGLWACHLGPELGGQGYGQLKLALMNELIGRSPWASVIFGCQAPDTGNAEIIAMYGTEEQKARYLKPLLDGECFSGFSMTEPHAGSDPRLFRTRAVRDDGDGWVITGEKYFTSNAANAAFLIVMAVTDPDAHPYQRMSMFLVPGRHPRHRDRAQRRDDGPPGRRRARPHPLQRRAGRRRTRCSARWAGRSRSPRRAWAAAGSTTRCARSPRSRRRST